MANAPQNEPPVNKYEGSDGRNFLRVNHWAKTHQREDGSGSFVKDTANFENSYPNPEAENNWSETASYDLNQLLIHRELVTQAINGILAAQAERRKKKTS